MRNAFADEITKIAAEDPSLVLLSGDIGNRLFDKFKDVAPERFLNCGVAESNMVGMAAGMALSGLRPVVYTIASFLLFRPYEQIRIDVGYHDLPVVFVGVGGGLGYASNGGTHQSLEDVAAMRTIPGIQILSAGDAWEVRSCLRAAYDSKRPTYLRIGKKKEPVIHSGSISGFKLGKAIPIHTAKDPAIAILVTGNLLPDAASLIAPLSEQGVSANLYSMPSVCPFDTDLVNNLLVRGTKIVVIEEHNVNGGLGSEILEWMHYHRLDTRNLLRIGTPNAFLHRTANHKQARGMLGLTAEQILPRLLDFIRQNS